MKFILKNFSIFLCSFISILLAADEELIVTGSYFEDKSLDSSPVDLISFQEIENFNLSSLSEIGKYIHTSSGSHFQSDSM